MLTVLARWCVRRRYLVLGAWIALLIALGGAVGAAGTAFSDSTRLPSSDSASAYALLARAGAAGSGTSGTIVWHTDTGSAVSATARAHIEPMLAAVSHLDGVTGVASPLGSAGAGRVSADGHTAYATVSFSATTNAGQAKSLASRAATSTLSVQTGGKAFTNQIPSEASESIGVLAALVILLLVFRAPWAAALPILTGVAGVAISSVAVMLLSHVLTLSSISLSMSALIGLGVGIDYALFIVNRQRKALRAGADLARATATAMNTSGRAVLFAGATVVVALLGMLVLGVGFLTGIAVAAAVTVACTVAAATTLLPALLGATGLRVLRKRERAVLAAEPAGASTTGACGFWGHWSRIVERRPRSTALVAGAVLVTLALPALVLRLGTADVSSDPTGSATRSYYATMSSAFGPGFDSQLILVAQTPDAHARAAWTHLIGELPTLRGVASVGTPETPASQIAMISLTPTTTSQAKATADLVSRLRSDVIVDAEHGTDLHVHVGGSTATSIDFADALTSKLPVFLAIVTVLGFVLLTVAFRSLLLPLLGALGNLLTIVIALGATVALFQWGWGPSLFGIGGAAPIEYIVTMLVVGVMFGLSMDYHVFLVSRMHEDWTATNDHRGAVRAGVADTGRVIATAAAIMGCVFASFGFAGMRTASEFGVALAIGVLADAFLLRLTVIPALLHLIGRRAWALPAALDKVLPHVSVEGATDTAPVAPGDDAATPDVLAAR